MTVESLIATLDVEEKARAKDSEKNPPQPIPNANVVQNGAGSSGAKNYKKKGKAKQTTNFKKKKNKEKGDFTCFVCGEPGHIARKCRMRKDRKEVGQQSANVTVSEAGGGSG